MVSILPLDEMPEAAVEALLDRAFEPGRRARISYRVREGMTPIANLCFGAVETDVAGVAVLVGSIQGWPASLVEEGGRAWPLVMVGPVAVDPACQRSGIGLRLMARMLAAAADTGQDGALMLIGDPEYYGRFGFTAERTAAWVTPGLVEPRRLLARGPDVPTVAGMLGPRVAPTMAAAVASAR